MEKNLYLVLAEELGLKPYDEFLMIGYGTLVFTFTEERLCYISNNNGETKYIACDAEHLSTLVTFGEDWIVKLPFNPEDGDTYYAADVFAKDVLEGTWEGDTLDCALKVLGLIHPTYEVAEENLEDDLKKLKGIQ